MKPQRMRIAGGGLALGLLLLLLLAGGAAPPPAQAAYLALPSPTNAGMQICVMIRKEYIKPGDGLLGGDQVNIVCNTPSANESRKTVYDNRAVGLADLNQDVGSKAVGATLYPKVPGLVETYRITVYVTLGDAGALVENAARCQESTCSAGYFTAQSSF